jgi:hypothetical protein
MNTDNKQHSCDHAGGCHSYIDCGSSQVGFLTRKRTCQTQVFVACRNPLRLYHNTILVATTGP